MIADVYMNNKPCTWPGFKADNTNLLLYYPHEYRQSPSRKTPDHPTI